LTHLELGQLGRECLDPLATLVDEVATGETVEDLEDPYRIR